jgi:antirestriction protein ArdC
MTSAYDIVAKTIIDQLEKGTAPWRKEWVSSGYAPKSLSSKKRYNGINHWLLSFSAESAGYESPWWGTFAQIKGQGGNVRKGEKGTAVVLWREVDSTVDDEGGTKKAVVLRYFTVFNAEQAEWETAPEYEKLKDRDSVKIIDTAQKLVNDYYEREKLSVFFKGDRAFYSPKADTITLPHPAGFTSAEAFYATSFHEIAHSTGHKDRLDRGWITENHYFGSELYSEEELVAEFTSAFLSSETGIAPATLDNSASYIASWLKVLKNDPKLLIKAVGRAQKAATFVIEGKAITK